MDVLPFVCPGCGLPSVSLGICPECRVRLVARATAPLTEAPTPVPSGETFEEGRAVYRGTPQECERVAQRLRREGVPVAMAREAEERRGLTMFHLLVPAGWEPRVREVLAADWERETEAQGLDPVTQDEALALEAQGLCPACGDALMPEAAACSSCGIALA